MKYSVYSVALQSKGDVNCIKYLDDLPLTSIEWKTVETNSEGFQEENKRKHDIETFCIRDITRRRNTL